MLVFIVKVRGVTWVWGCRARARLREAGGLKEGGGERKRSGARSGAREVAWEGRKGREEMEWREGRELREQG